jgi:hypothetical protein
LSLAVFRFYLSRLYPLHRTHPPRLSLQIGFLCSLQ